jgi:hypothetical protein
LFDFRFDDEIENQKSKRENYLGELWQDTLMPTANCAVEKNKNCS